jgi:hypothetical protein
VSYFAATMLLKKSTIWLQGINYYIILAAKIKYWFILPGNIKVVRAINNQK